MTVNGGVKVATALLAGYVLGRTGRGKLVVGATVGALAAGRGLRGRKIPMLSGPTALLAEQAAKRLSTTAGRALTARAEKLSDALHERTTVLREADRGRPDGQAEQEDQAGRRQRPEDEDRSEIRSDERSDEDEPRAPERPSRAGRDAGRAPRRPPRRAPRR